MKPARSSGRKFFPVFLYYVMYIPFFRSKFPRDVIEPSAFLFFFVFFVYFSASNNGPNRSFWYHCTIHTLELPGALTSFRLIRLHMQRRGTYGCAKMKHIIHVQQK